MYHFLLSELMFAVFISQLKYILTEVGFCCLFACLFVVGDRSHCVALTDLERSLLDQHGLSSQKSVCLRLPSLGIKHMLHCGEPQLRSYKSKHNFIYVFLLAP